MKRAIWGTGYNASKFFASIGEEHISFFIDSDTAKDGFYLGKRVLSPDKVENWDNLFVYVPDNYYNEISNLLMQKGLSEKKNFEKYGNKTFLKKEQALADFRRAMDEIETVKNEWRGHPLFVAAYSFIKKDYREYIRYLVRSFGNRDIKIVSGAYWEKRERVEKEWDADVINALAISDDYAKVTDIYPEGCTNHAEAYLREVMTQMARIQDDPCVDGYLFQAGMVRDYFDALLSSMSPPAIIAYDSVSPSRIILNHLCRQRGIPIIFTHPGIIPGTLAFDVDGEMGESLPAILYERFCRLSVDETDLCNAKKVWKYLYESKLNRKIQPRNNVVTYIKERIDVERPTVFLAGQNDTFSHMVPYTEQTKKYHSPVFQSSFDVVPFVAEICERNHWNLVYKPHPMFSHPEEREKMPPNVIFVEFGDINDVIDIADVTVTILSSTNYNALIRYKPVVMLGYTQLRGKGCTYEAFEKEKIEPTIMEAIQNGFTQEQQEAFLLHMAQCLKYYLYDDLQERPIRYGRPVPKSFDEFYELERLLKGDKIAGK